MASPSWVLAGDSQVSIRLTGTSLPVLQDQITDLRVGGATCGTVTIVENGTALQCNGLNWVTAEAARRAPNATDGRGVVGGSWPDIGSRITVVDQSSDLSAAVELVPPPLVTGMSPEEAGPGDTVLITGIGFGKSSADIVMIRLGQEPCDGGPEDWWVSETRLQCRIPVDHRLWAYVALNPGSVQPYVGVEVVTRTNVSNLRRYDMSGQPATISSGLTGSDGDLIPPGDFGMGAPEGARLIPKGIA